MPYLIENDFKRFIQADNLQQVINKDDSILQAAMLDSQTTAKEYLVQKYVIASELTDTPIYDVTVAYKAGQRVYLDAAPYSNALTYALNVLTLQNGNVYKCTTAIVVAESFNLAHWTLLGTEFQLFFVQYPNPLFVLNNQYNKGDIVFWNGKNYTNVIATGNPDHEAALQYGTYSNLPLTNVFPDDPTQGKASWGVGISYSVAANTLPNTLYWTAGDNRNRSLVRHMLAIALYIIHDRISPRNVPELRKARYRESIGWLKDCAEGNITADLPLIQPRSGGRIRWGSNIRNTNSY